MGSPVSAETTSLTKLPPGLARVCRVLRGIPPRVRGGPQRTRTRGRSSLDGDRLRGGSPPVAAPPQATCAAPVPHTRGLPSCWPLLLTTAPPEPSPLGRASGVFSLPGGARSITPASAVCVCVCARVRASRSAFPPLTPTSASLVAQSVKNPPAMQETGVPSLGQGRSPGQGNGNPLQYPWLDHPTDRGAWRATVHGVAKSRTGLSD